ncbi:MAG: tetratricopeptide repeat protein, partial [Pseudomonadota bacterium]
MTLNGSSRAAVFAAALSALALAGAGVAQAQLRGGEAPSLRPAAPAPPLIGLSGPAETVEDAFDAGRAWEDCGFGDAEACNELGWRHEFGRGVRQDMDLAVALYRRACDGGDGIACSNLGYLYSEGQGVPLDHAQANRLLDLACLRRSERGCALLGYQTYHGHGARADLDEAARLYDLACDLGSSHGCRNLGRGCGSHGTSRDR